MILNKRIWLIGLFCLAFSLMKAQENLVPLTQQAKEGKTFGSKKQRITLPFIDDFSYDSPYPDTTLWLDKQVYINNTMSAEPPTRGVATFDGLNAYGRPYFPGQFSMGFADSLTSKPIDLSSYTTNSGVFLSFYVQPQGLGFAPEATDSLFLFLKNDANQWVQVWSKWGTPWQPFRIVMIPVNQAQFLHAGFQFRFVNIASLNLNDDIWNLDYVKLDANRNVADTNMNDIAMTIPPGSILFPYTAMPYRHFNSNANAELSSQQLFQIHNLYNQSYTVTPSHRATDSASATVLNATTLPSAGIAQKSLLNQAIPSFPVSITPPNINDRVLIQNKYYCQSPGANDRIQNDTIVRNTIFDQCFAYDDGTAEKAYFLFAANNFPAKTAMKFHLNQSDTIRGLQVFFAAQVPTALGKYFSVVLYQRLAGSGLTDSILFQQDLYRVQYDSQRNGFMTCAFNQGVILPAGNYFIGITQPANFGSDSLYYGLDVNTDQNTQQLYYNVDGSWYGSSAPGTLMMRLLTGPAVSSTGLAPYYESNTTNLWHPYPNPAASLLYLPSGINYRQYRLLSIDGRCLMHGAISNEPISVQTLSKGLYWLEAIDASGQLYRAAIQK